MYVFLKNQTTERARSLGSVQCQGSQVLISVLKTLVPSDYQVSTIVVSLTPQWTVTRKDADGQYCSHRYREG